MTNGLCPSRDVENGHGVACLVIILQGDFQGPAGRLSPGDTVFLGGKLYDDRAQYLRPQPQDPEGVSKGEQPLALIVYLSQLDVKRSNPVETSRGVIESVAPPNCTVFTAVEPMLPNQQLPPSKPLPVRLNDPHIQEAEVVKMLDKIDWIKYVDV